MIVDSSVLVDHLRGDETATQALSKMLLRGRVRAPTLVAWGLWKGANTPQRRESVAQLLAALDPDPFMPAMAQLAGDLTILHDARGMRRPVVDVLIASHAIHHGVPLATRDRDYSWIEGLDVIVV